MGAEFVTFDNAVNAMPLLCRVLYEGAAYMAVLKNFLCLFYYLRIIRRADYRAEITVMCNIDRSIKACFCFAEANLSTHKYFSLMYNDL